MLHDSWAAKMHDLTYKPMGLLGARHKAMMEIFGDTLERFEQQSQLLRAEIVERWQAGRKRRKLAYLTLLDGSSVFVEEKDASPGASKISSQITSTRKDLAGCLLDYPALVALTEEINNHSDEQPFEALVLAASLTANRGAPDLCNYLVGHMDRCLATARTLDQAKIPSRNLVIIPLAFSAAGNLDAAIDYSREMLSEEFGGK